LNLSEILPQYSNFAKNCNFNFFNTSENIGEHSVCNFSTKFFGGREFALGRGEILPKVSPKVSPKFLKNCVSSKFHQNCNTNKESCQEAVWVLTAPKLLLGRELPGQGVVCSLSTMLLNSEQPQWFLLYWKVRWLIQ